MKTASINANPFDPETTLVVLPVFIPYARTSDHTDKSSMPANAVAPNIARTAIDRPDNWRISNRQRPTEIMAKKTAAPIVDPQKMSFAFKCVT
ncbi:hypothetical protein E2553_40475 [Paraburkholderia dipogonis]|uniref:Uncharacterized protein n=1 Tax=Paraburkholderia dipogonis TaxID=1211383 RepID=A0A4Y8MJN0_9BURK|nr:hypothetical protein [Paraburkholderia dipogonis]TFE37680.1 hypothetical protein E2553_40475 [Paraburkholderia dipogonis]